MHGPVACTIVANNYLAYARVFTRSFLEHHPAGRVCVLVVDRPDPSLRYAEEPFETIFVEELGVPDFLHLAFRYSILELSTAVKPFFLLHLQRRFDLDRVCYFDPDILVLAPLDELYEELGTSDLVLTPHVTAPIEDAKIPGERDFLLSGIYNLGFLGVRFGERTLPFLDWWHRRLLRDCHHAVERGLFVDQRWMDLAPAFLERARIWHDPGCNVAYWNLPHRTLAERAGRWWVGERPLRFFHFSGFLPEQPERVSRFQNRYVAAQRPDLEPLLRDYARRLAAADHATLERLPYAFGHFADGTPVPAAARRLLNQADPDGRRWPDPFATAGPEPFLAWVHEPDDPGAQPPLPRLALAVWDQHLDVQRAFATPQGRDRRAYAAWLVAHARQMEVGDAARASLAAALRDTAGAVPDVAPSRGEAAGAEDAEGAPVVESELGRRPRLPRLALEVHRLRADLRTMFPDPLGRDRSRFAVWFVTSGRQEYDLPPATVRPTLRSLGLRRGIWSRLWWWRHLWRQPRRAPEETPAPLALTATPAIRSTPTTRGLNVIGWLTAPTGVGEACRGTLAALDRAELPRAVWRLGNRMELPSPSTEDGGEGLPFEICLLHVNADMTAAVVGALPRALLAGRYRIGYWFWELAHLPLDFATAFRHLDEVWAPSRFCLDAFRALAPIEVRWVPPTVLPPAGEPADREALGVPPESFLFLSAFDARSVGERKNPRGLVAAFARAVAASDRPLHLLLKVSHLDADQALASELRRAIAGLPVTLLAASLSRAEMSALTLACDAYVSLHRSEGLGLPLIEAMVAGKPVVATGYGGVCDFLDESTGWVVGHRLVALREARGPYPAGAVWAEPDPEHAVEQMLAVARADATAARVAAARARVDSLYSPAAGARRLTQEIDRVASLLAARRAGRAANRDRAGIAGSRDGAIDTAVGDLTAAAGKRSL